jgi:hypothetical protein
MDFCPYKGTFTPPSFPITSLISPIPISVELLSQSEDFEDSFRSLCYRFKEAHSRGDYSDVFETLHAIVRHSDDFKLPSVVRILRETCFLKCLRTFIGITDPDVDQSDQSLIRLSLSAIDVCIHHSVILAQEICCQGLILTISESMDYYHPDLRGIAFEIFTHVFQTPRRIGQIGLVQHLLKHAFKELENPEGIIEAGDFVCAVANQDQLSRKCKRDSQIRRLIVRTFLKVFENGQYRFYSAILRGLYFVGQFEPAVFLDFPEIFERSIQIIETNQTDKNVYYALHIVKLYLKSFEQCGDMNCPERLIREFPVFCAIVRDVTVQEFLTNSIFRMLSRICRRFPDAVSVLFELGNNKY